MSEKSLILIIKNLIKNMNYKKIVLSFCIFAVFCGVFLLKPSNAKAITAEELRAQMDALLKQIEQLRA